MWGWPASSATSTPPTAPCSISATVCDNDPRTSEQRRADACGPLARGEARWPASAGQNECPATAERNAAAAAIIHVLAEQATIDRGQ